MADREPKPASGRLATVRPDPRPSSDHAGHDRWLVVRWTSDPTDLTPAETAQARALLAACPDCAALAADLEVITRATVTSAVPTRPRDFRLTAGQATSTHGGTLDRLRRWLGSPGWSTARPLAGAALAIGLMIMVVAPGLHGSVTTSGDGMPQDPTTVQASAHAFVAADAATAEPRTTAATKSTTPPANPEVAGAELYADPGASDDPSRQADTMLRASASADATEQPGTASALGHESAPPRHLADVGPESDGNQGGSPTGDAREAPMDDTTFALMLLGIVLAGTGLLVLVLGWLARRWQDPLLR